MDKVTRTYEVVIDEVQKMLDTTSINLVDAKALILEGIRCRNGVLKDTTVKDDKRSIMAKKLTTNMAKLNMRIRGNL